MGKECKEMRIWCSWLDWRVKMSLEGMLKSLCKYLNSRLEMAGVCDTELS